MDSIAKNAARMPLISALHGTSGQGNTDPDLITLFRGWARLSTDPHGQLEGRPLQGFFLAGAHLVTQYRLKANGKPLLRTFSIQSSANQWCGVFLIPGTLTQGRVSDLQVADGSVEVSVHRHLDACWFETIRVRSHSNGFREAHLELELECPIGDVEFAEEMKAEREAAREGLAPQVRWKNGLPELHYERNFGTRRNAPTPELYHLLGETAPKNGEVVSRGIVIGVTLENSGNCEPRFHLSPGKVSQLQLRTKLAPRAWMELHLRFQPTIDGRRVPAVPPASRVLVPLPRRESDHPSTHTVIRTGNPTLNQIISQAQVDLELLRLSPSHPLEQVDQGRANEDLIPRFSTFSAGIPRYIGVFGRDTLTTAWQAALFSPRYLEPALSLTGVLRGVRNSAWRDEEPDRMLHERRLNPMSVLGESNREIYYGDVASTPFWIVTLAAAYHWTGDKSLLKRHFDTFEACIRWLKRKLREGDGFIYYAPALADTPGSNPNQAWKDSDDAIVDGEGRNRRPPHATAEIQGYCYLAFISAAEITLAQGHPARAIAFLREAAALKRRFNQAFWLPEKRFFALALDGNGKPIDAIASNIAHCLGTGLINQEKLEPVARRLLSPELFSGWGVRTLSSENPAYDPFSYHRGSVWPVENSTIAAGLFVCGYVDEAITLIGSQFALATLFPNMRLPEVVSGHERSEEYPAPGLYPQANLLQSWSVSAISFYLQILFGLRPLAPLKILLLKPVLPDWLPWAEIHDLQVGRATVSLRFWRDRRGQSRWRILKRQGFLIILEQPPELSSQSRAVNRARDALKSYRVPLLWAGAIGTIAAVISCRRILKAGSRNRPERETSTVAAGSERLGRLENAIPHRAQRVGHANSKE